MQWLFDGIGLIGAGLLLASYFLLEREVVTTKDARYWWMNLVSALLIGISLLYSWNLASFVIECAWLVISLRGLYSVYRGRTA